MARFRRGMRVRVPEELPPRFDAQAALHQRDRSQMLRELIEAFADGRVTIHLRPEHKRAQGATYE